MIYIIEGERMNLLFSYLYLNNYRTIKNKEISFDHRYKLDLVSRSIKRGAEKGEVFGREFYGKNIYSATCLVGKNGEGKTSLVDFLRDSFALMKNDIDNEYLLLSGEKSGVVELTEKDVQFYHLDKDTAFVVIFKINGTDYYVTNMKNVRVESGADMPQGYDPKIEGLAGSFQTAYFSMMRFQEGVAMDEQIYGRSQYRKMAVPGKKPYDFQNVLEQYNVDFSEEAMNRKRAGKDAKAGINADLLMQLIFLSGYEDACLRKILGEDYRKRLEIVSDEFKYDFGIGRLRIENINIDGEWMTSFVRAIVSAPLAYLRPFSSGQFSRFAFLARLYWYMGGGERFCDAENMKTIQEEEKRRNLSDDKIKWLEASQLKSQSVVLLIDEGDLYYHPEWQRCFVDDVFKLISAYGENGKRANVQVVFTTSSTFMLSDILREDVVVLSEADRVKMPYLDENVQTYGQNIHMLLANRFFMDSSIGVGSERMIRTLFKLLSVQTEEDGKEKNENPDQRRQRVQDGIREYFESYIKAHTDEFATADDVDNFIFRLIGSIGEDFYRRQLLEMFEEYKRYTRRLGEKLERARQILAELEKPDETTQEVLKLLTEIQKEGTV